jgi:transcription initiation factor TFIIB
MKFKLIYEDDYLNEDGCCADLSTVLIDGDIICSNCGCILGKNFVEEQKRAYSFEEINERIQHSPRWREFGPRTIIPNTNLDSKGQSLEPQGKRLFTRLSKIQNSLISSIERNFWESKPKLNLFASKLNLPEYIRETAWKIYTVVVKKKMTMGRSIEGFLAASTYAAIRIHEFPRLLEDVCDASMNNRRSVIKYLGLLNREILPELSLNYKPITFEQLIFKFGNDLYLSMEIQKKALELLSKVKGNGISYIGKDPKGFAASALYIASKKTSERKSQIEIAKIAKITEVTLRNRIKDIINKL